MYRSTVCGVWMNKSEHTTISIYICTVYTYTGPLKHAVYYEREILQCQYYQNDNHLGCILCTLLINDLLTSNNSPIASFCLRSNVPTTFPSWSLFSLTCYHCYHTLYSMCMILVNDKTFLGQRTMTVTNDMHLAPSCICPLTWLIQTTFEIQGHHS